MKFIRSASSFFACLWNSSVNKIPSSIQRLSLCVN